MKQITNREDIKSLGTIMSIWAHPDDESYLAAGIMATAVANGQKVICITATRGEAGSQDEVKWPPETLGQVRENELQNALACLGVKEHHWLGYTDGCLEIVEQNQAVDTLIRLIERHMPDTILTFGPDGLTGHTDYATVSRWADKASTGRGIQVYHAVHSFDQYEKYLKAADERLNIFFNIDKPPLLNEEQIDISFRIPDDICEKKCAAIGAMPSQTEVFFKLFGKDYIKQAFKTEYFILSKNS